MGVLVVVDNPKDWPLDIPNGSVVSARSYLTNPSWSTKRRLKVFNLCKSYRYQSVGYYVSLLAEARGHRPLPNVSAIQDMKMQTLLRFTSEELDDLIQKSLAPLESNEFVLSIYFGKNLAKRHERLSTELFNLFQAPLLRAHFVKDRDKWELQSMGPIAASEIPLEHQAFAFEVSKTYFEGRGFRTRKETKPRYDMSILHNATDPLSPSDDKAIRRFIRAAEDLDLDVEILGKDDYARIAEFDGLLIRETTRVNHHTFRFARRAAFEGLVVIDDPQSILRCTNKVYLQELWHRHHIPTPKTVVVHKDNLNGVIDALGLPLVLKQPDSSFSQGVVRIENLTDLEQAADEFLDKSELVLAQEYVPTDYDWRVGVLDRRPLFVARYFMAKSHWQIVTSDGDGHHRFGRVETYPVEEAPPMLVQTALNAANLIGDGLYGVDIKQVGDRFLVIEVNDNPNIDGGCEDAVLKDELYRRVMEVFLRRMEARTERART